MNVLIAIQHRFEQWVPPAWFAERLRREFASVQCTRVTRYADAGPYWPEADVLVGYSLRAEQLARAARLCWIHSTAAAVHGLMIPELVASEIVVTNASRVHGPVVAEHAWALVLALARRLHAAWRYQQQRRWSQEELWRARPQPREVAGATLLLVGVGAIGGEVARRAVDSGMRVIAVREHPERGVDFLPGAENGAAVQVVGYEMLDTVLPEADFVVLAAPLTEKTRGLIGRAQLGKMKPEAYLVNVSRGALVDEAALAEALAARRIGGAGLDVFAEEPLPEASPLWTLPDVILTPHSASFSTGIWERQYALFAENLRRFLAGGELLGVVDKRKGY
jgi:phosphoglycerate dehydrogenase-like enzyme